MWGITRSREQKIKFNLREGEKGKYKVDGKGVHKVLTRNNHEISEKHQGNHPFSQSQSTSYIIEEAPSDLFGHDRNNPKLSGILVKKSDIYMSNFISIYDNGTVFRPHHFL